VRRLADRVRQLERKFNVATNPEAYSVFRFTMWSPTAPDGWAHRYWLIHREPGQKGRRLHALTAEEADAFREGRLTIADVLSEDTSPFS
jgi:hypothetical protein